MPDLPDVELLGPLGEGAFGTVYRARQLSLDRLVAVKVLATQSDAVLDDDRERFIREARVLALLDCPSIVKVFDIVVQDDCICIVMELVDGHSLQAVMQDGLLDRGPALNVLGDVAAALAAAADAGVVHRDVKPANIFVGADGRAKLGDFGLSRTSSPDIFRTVSGAPGGTPAFLAPELIAGAEPDHRSDAYAFAVTCYLTWVGRHPFDTSSAAGLLAAHLHQEPALPSEVHPGVGEQIDTVLLCGLSKDPATRCLPEQLVAALAAVDDTAWSNRSESASVDLRTRAWPAPAQKAIAGTPVRGRRARPTDLRQVGLRWWAAAGLGAGVLAVVADHLLR